MTALARAVLWVTAAFYGYGALVHVLNITGQGGFDWGRAPLKWQVLDGVYLVLDVLVLRYLPVRSWIGVAGFFVAAVSQILLYTVGRGWVLDVPPEFAPAADQIAYLDTLVLFHAVTLVAVAAALVVLRRR